MITKKRYVSVFAICLLLLFAGCSSLQPKDTVTQVSTIDALLTGAYDGSMTCGELVKHGNLGIGTFDHLDGEMVLVDGVVYQVKADGKVYVADKALTTPFAAVCRFVPDRTIAFDPNVSYEQVQAAVDRAAPNPNLFCAIDITGTFARMHTRSVPAQNKPYPPLAQVTSHQPEFVMENVSGRIVGFRSPAYVKGIGVPGYHLHFISDDRTQGGHILGFEMAKGIGAVDVCDRLLLILPEDDALFGAADLAVDRGKELESVEK